MSGGVDSSVAAYLLQQQGYACIGVTMRLYENETAGIPRGHTCCSLDDVEDARAVAYDLGMPYYVLNFTEEFDEKVIRKFVQVYQNGGTPIPCIDCNRYLKFNSLYHRAEELGCHYVVTGHYARIEQREDGRYLLKKAADPAKDQSYVLYSLTQEQLAHTMFPLGDMNKHQTRMIADQQNFYNADKPDSQDICFVPDGDYAGFIRRFTGKDYPAGDFTDKDGNVLGHHKGIIGYTVGQRKGLGIAFPQPMYVKEKDVTRNRIVLCPGHHLYAKSLMAEDFNWIVCDKPPAKLRAAARVRYNQKEAPATVFAEDDGRVRVEFDEPQRAITAGQAVVVYDGDVVVGGGTIVSADDN